MMRLILLLLLLPQQAPSSPTLIRNLGNDDAAVREEAMAALAARGDAALPELRRALEDPDSEIRIRAEILVGRRAQEHWLADRMQSQRPAKLRLAKLPREYEYPEAVAETEGLRVTFRRRPWAPDGALLGTIFSTEISPAPGLETQWRVTSIRDGRDLPVETCTRHSPKRVYVPGAAPAAAVVRIQGTRRWYCDVPLLLRNPSNGMSRRIGGYTVRVLWPVIQVRSDKPLPERVMARVLRDEDVSCTVRPECVDGISFGFGIGAGSRCGARKVRKLAWCGCPGEPDHRQWDSESLSTETQAQDPSTQHYEVQAIQSIALTLHLPVEEPFEVTSPPLKDAFAR